MQQIKFVLFTERHDVEDSDPQWTDVLTFCLFRLDPGDAIALDGCDLVIVGGKDQSHVTPSLITHLIQEPERNRL